LNAGQDLRLAVREGFGKAFGTIIDANMTTLITALVLTWTGSGPVQGFGVVLSVGICTSVFCALVVTRFILDICIYKLGWEKLTMLSIIGDTSIDFLRWRWPAAAVSIAIVAAGLFSMVHKGQNFLGVDFIGGDALTMSYKQRVDVAQLRDALEKSGSKDNTIQYQSNNQLFVKTQYEKGEHAIQTLQQAFPAAGFSAERVDRVGPTVGWELTKTAIWSLALASIGILIYISARFEFAYAVGAVVALLHDVLITLGVFVLAGRELTLPAIGALLTIGGYSLNDTVVVFDRIREEVQLKGDRLDFARIINLSVNRVLLIFGGGVINDFAFILVVGVITGTYSSVFIAAPILLFWHPSHLKPQTSVTATQAELRA
jgi:SecD/SecF fusion protein